KKEATGRADIEISGTYTGTPTAIEARWNGGSWATIDAAPAGGTFSGTLASQAKGQGTLEVRHVDTPANVASQEYVGVGVILACLGQSNMVGQTAGAAGVFQSGNSANYVATVFTNEDVWRLGGDAYDNNYNQIDAVSSDTGGASFVIPMARTLMES